MPVATSVGLTDVKRVTSKIDGPAVAVVVEHTLSRCPRTVPHIPVYHPVWHQNEWTRESERDWQSVGEWMREGSEKRQRDDVALEGGKVDASGRGWKTAGGLYRAGTTEAARCRGGSHRGGGHRDTALTAHRVAMVTRRADQW